MVSQEPAAISLGSFYQQPDLTYYDALEDKNKNIWLSSDNGLYKFTGTNFQEYFTSAQKSNAFFSLKEVNQSVWMVNLYGQLLKTQKDSLQVVANLSPYLKGKLAEIYPVKNKLYLTSQAGLLTYDCDRDKLLQLNTESILATWQDPKTQAIYYFNDRNEFKRISAEKIETLTTLISLSSTEKLHSRIYNFWDEIYLSYVENNRAVLSKWNAQTSKFEKIKFFDNDEDLRIYSYLSLEDHILLATNRGVLQLDRNFKLIEHSFKDVAVSKIFKDFQGNTWITTLKNGVFVIPQNHFLKVKLPLAEESVTTFTQLDYNKAVIGTSKGKLLWLDQNLEVVKEIQLPDHQPVTQLLYRDEQQELLISLENLSAYRYNLNNNQIQNFQELGSSKALTAVKNGFLHLTYRAAFYYPNHSEEPQLLKDKRAVNAFYNAATETFFIAYIDELIAYDKDLNETKITYQNQPVLATSFTLNDDQLLIGTRQQGVLAYKNRTTKSYLTTAKNLSHNSILDVASSSQELFILTKEGLQIYDFHLKKITKNFSYIDKVDLKKLLIFQDQLLIAGNKDLLAVNLSEASSAQKNKLPPTPILQKITTEDATYTSAENLKFKPDQKNIQITYQAPGLQLGQAYRYKYRLSNLSDHWEETLTGLTSLIFTYLPSGNYDLEIKTIDATGTESEESLCITFEIETPFYRELWFYLLVIVLILVLILVGFKVLLNRKNKKQQKKLLQLEHQSKINELRLENIRSQMNPHFIFNALNAIQDYILSNEKKLASSYLVKFSRLIRMYLEHSQKNFISLAEELEALKLYIELEKIRIEESFDFSLEVSEKIQLNHIKVPSLFIQPYVENAIKHGLLHKKGAKQLKISFEQKEDFICCKIEDNGIGVENAQRINRRQLTKHKSFALDANEERIHLYNRLKDYNIEVNLKKAVEDEENPGTLVTLKIPINLK